MPRPRRGLAAGRYVRGHLSGVVLCGDMATPFRSSADDVRGCQVVEIFLADGHVLRTETPSLSEAVAWVERRLNQEVRDGS